MHSACATTVGWRLHFHQHSWLLRWCIFNVPASGTGSYGGMGIILLPALLVPTVVYNGCTSQCCWLLRWDGDYSFGSTVGFYIDARVTRCCLATEFNGNLGGLAVENLWESGHMVRLSSPCSRCFGTRCVWRKSFQICWIGKLVSSWSGVGSYIGSWIGR